MYAELLAETVTEVDRKSLASISLVGGLLQGPWAVSAAQAVDLRRSLRASRVRSPVRQGAHQTRASRRCRDVSQPVRLSRLRAGPVRRTARFARAPPARLHRVEVGREGTRIVPWPAGRCSLWATRGRTDAAVSRGPRDRRNRRLVTSVTLAVRIGMRRTTGISAHGKRVSKRVPRTVRASTTTEHCHLLVASSVPMASTPCRHGPRRRANVS